MDDYSPQTIAQLAQHASKPEVKAGGPGDVGPTSDTQDPKSLVTLPFDDTFVSDWRARITESDDRFKKRWELADILLDEYLPVVTRSGAAETVKVNGHFRNVHSKLGQLFYRDPDVTCEADDPGPAQNNMPNPMNAMVPPGMPPLPPLTADDIIAVKQAVLRKKLGRDGIKVGRLMDEMLFDVLAWAGIGCAKVGYRGVFKTIQKPVMEPDPTAPPQPPTDPAPGSIFGLSTPPPQPPAMRPAIDPMTGQPKTEPVQVPIYREWYARRFSPKKLIANTDLYSTRYDSDATFIGMHFYMSPQRAMKTLGLTEDEASKVSKDEMRHLFADDQGTGEQGLVHGQELWIKLEYFTDEPHPLAIGQLVLVEGVDRPIIWRMSPDQTFGEDGQITPDSLDSFPIKVLSIRDIADSCLPLSDAAFTNSGIKQLSTWTRQSVQMRDANIGKFLVDSSGFDDVELAKIKDGTAGEIIPVVAGKLAGGSDKLVAPMQKAQIGADDFRARSMLKQDNDEILGISANQAGAPEDTVRSATETATIQTAVSARNDKELSRTIDLYLDIVRAVDQLLMRYADQNEYVRIAGTAGAQRMQVWNNQLISGKYLYDIAPDSQIRVDTARDFQLLLNFYNLAAADPIFNRSYVLKKLARMRGLDPTKVVLDPASQMQQPPHGVSGAGPVNKHEAANSGGRPNAPGQVNHRQEQAAMHGTGRPAAAPQPQPAHPVVPPVGVPHPV